MKLNVLKSLFCKKQDRKEIVKQWILTVEQEHTMPDGIVALNFGLYEGPYSIDLIGSKLYDANNDDWACEEDYVPEHRICPALNISASENWEEVLNGMFSLLKEVIQETPNLQLWKVEYITIGFSGGDLLRIK